MKREIKLSELRERKVNLFFHSQNIPLLIDPKFLRSKQCGQVDCCVFDAKKTLIKIIEVKGRAGISQTQLNRLRGTSQLLGLIFNCAVLLKTAIFENDNGFKTY
ncbi:MAG: hypothetical protein ACPGJV_13175 [Bacteriovoracaceae bacterium]